MHINNSCFTQFIFIFSATLASLPPVTTSVSTSRPLLPPINSIAVPRFTSDFYQPNYHNAAPGSMFTAGPSPASYAEVFARLSNSSGSRSSSAATSHPLPVVADLHPSSSRPKVPQPIHNPIEQPQDVTTPKNRRSPINQTLVAAAHSIAILEPVQLSDPDFSEASNITLPQKSSHPAVPLSRAPPVAKKPEKYVNRSISPEPCKPAKPARLISFESDSATDNDKSDASPCDISSTDAALPSDPLPDLHDPVNDLSDQPAAAEPAASPARAPTPVVNIPAAPNSPESAGSESPVLSPRATVRERKANLDARARRRERKAKRDSRPLSGVEEVVLQDRLELFSDEPEATDSSNLRPDKEQTAPSPQPRSIKPASHNLSAPPGGN